MTTPRVIEIAREIEKDPNATSAYLRDCAMNVPDDASEYDVAWRKETITLFTFRALFTHMEVLMGIPEQALLSHLLWCWTRRFEMTPPQFDLMMDALRRDRSTKFSLGKGIKPISATDFETLCVNAGII